ncbi:hypothetical protein DOTSEDRAFT_70274 [Dothistroma septosporum NZE10]|uniref:IEC3 subunit of the Ino80 complex, chromatin re-modelling-domain-containing protein n=1 Tax=Dothistroma septosporum (strain NZE10 / CBS 128990) TaxID=675120 RepID=N1PRX5_DOTSN|nr:hypothetical protein DOTSEDRAFT_70274 [Dothistroma septosporum NZE10]
MSDSEGVAAHPPPHPTTAGKSIGGPRPKYKSWRKKYRKMRHNFEGVLDENKKLFKEDQKMEGIARRLREELDDLRDLLLDINQNPALPASMRYNINLDKPNTDIASIRSVVDDNISPQEANETLAEYKSAVQRGQIPHMDLHVIRAQINQKLSAQDVDTLADIGSTTSHPFQPGPIMDQFVGSKPPGYYTTEEEDARLLRLDALLGDQLSLERKREKEQEGANEPLHWAEMTPREVERQVELQNPQSQHNWLKIHARGTGADADDTESLASHDPKPSAARGAKGKKRDLAQQVGDRAVGRARDGNSPGAASGAGDEEDYGFIDDHPQGSAKKRKAKDEDGAYRVKGGKSGGGNAKGKRKRATGDDGAVSGKKPKVDASVE